MKVNRIMSRNVVTIAAEAKLEEAAMLMKTYDIRHLPVVKNDRLTGLITERDVRGALFPAMLEEIWVKNLMILNPITITSQTMLEDAARVVYHKKIGCLPVVDGEGRVEGIITVADMLAALIEVMGFISTSSRLDVILPDHPEALEDACRILRRRGGEIIGVSVTQLDLSHPVHLFRLKKMDLGPIIEEMRKAGYEIVSELG